MDKPFIGAAERNKGYILNHLKDIFSQCSSVLEVGSGTGQHAVHFAPQLRHLEWQTSDLATNLKGISAWLRDYPYPNLPIPIELDIKDWPQLNQKYDGIFASNVIHYIEHRFVPEFFRHSAETLNLNGLLAMYGPFKEQDQYSSDGDLQLDLMLKSENNYFGLRNLEDLYDTAAAYGFMSASKIDLPANNKLVFWARS